MLNNTALMAAVFEMQRSLAKPGKGRCMGCNETKRVRGSWCAVGYEPADRTHPPMVYCICGECIQSQERRRRAALTVETMARDFAERRASS